MTEKQDARIIETRAIIVAYAMSRLDSVFLAKFGYRSWQHAFQDVGRLLGLPATSVKNLRDEFDPLHQFRKGWHKRPLRPSRQRVLGEFHEVSDDAILEVVRNLLAGGKREVLDEVIEPIAFASERIENVAERLKTGRTAEEFFLQYSEVICGVRSEDLIDRRNDAAGFDFGVADSPSLAIEVKGMKTTTGSVLFTDLEWRIARSRQEMYWLVVVGGIAKKPQGKLWKNPAESLEVSASLRRCTVVSWSAAVSLA